MKLFRLQSSTTAFLAASLLLVSCISCARSETASNSNLESEFSISTIARNTVSNANMSSGNMNSNAMTASDAVAGAGGGGRNTELEATNSNTTFLKASLTQNAEQAVERRIIRDATLALQADDPVSAGRRIASIAETNGGYVSSNETQQSGMESDEARGTSVTIIVRVPAETFSKVVEQIRATGSRVVTEKITGQDVTEEYVDLEARLRTKQALEAQFLEIMKTARTVTDTLAVQTEIGDVRTVIEQLEGRRRYLSNRTSLSTITVTLETPAPLVATSASGFFGKFARAFGDGVDIAAAIMLALVQGFVALLPLLLFVVLPLVFAARLYSKHRARRVAEQRATVTSSSVEPPTSTAS